MSEPFHKRVAGEMDRSERIIILRSVIGAIIGGLLMAAMFLAAWALL